MPPRPRSPATQPYYPTADTATFRDLLLFEERLKRNAGLLKRRKSRYQFYLLLLVTAVLIFLSDVLLETELFLLPLNHAVYYYYSYTRSLETIPKRDLWRAEDDADAGIYFHLPPYVKTGCLFVLGVTLFLFFASGMYSERVGYANKYVPHANKALRSFNMYLNVRTQPLPSRLSRMAARIGLGPLFGSHTPKETSQPSSPLPITPRARTRSLSPPFGPRRAKSPTTDGSYGVIPTIPPSSNPRGELIFSSRVHAAFREGYERYRENYERRLQSGGVLGNQGGAGAGMKRSLLERFKASFGGGGDTPAFGTPRGAETPLSGEFMGSSGSPTAGTPGTLRGRLSSGSTPSGSRRSSPAPGGTTGSAGGASPTGSVGPSGTLGKRGSRRRQGARISRQGTPLLEIVESIRADGVSVGGQSTTDSTSTFTTEPGTDDVASSGTPDSSPARRRTRPARSRSGSYAVS